jgi:hypothetical protein
MLETNQILARFVLCKKRGNLENPAANIRRCKREELFERDRAQEPVTWDAAKKHRKPQPPTVGLMQDYAAHLNQT